MGKVRPEQVLKLKEPTEGFLCSLSSNKYGIEFLSFSIADFKSKKVFFHVDKDTPVPVTSPTKIISENSLRTIKYNFSSDVLKTETVSTKLVFSIGRKPVKEMRLIERHYFRNKIIKSYDFSFGFCIPGSTNAWETVYSVPLLDEALIEEMITSPFETKSDSFYFVNNELVIHNKAEYAYRDAPKKSLTLNEFKTEEKEEKRNSKSPRSQRPKKERFSKHMADLRLK